MSGSFCRRDCTRDLDFGVCCGVYQGLGIFMFGSDPCEKRGYSPADLNPKP